MTKANKGKSQVSDFRKAARELGADESEEAFDAALKKVVRQKTKDDPMPDDPKKLVEWGKRNIQD
ncbi:MAG TPA: hypothetical protein VMI47_10835 [Pseudolabrys sp.]|nr:hypothetical protein [Pseudolabrys sp.]